MDIKHWKGVEYESIVSRLRITRAAEMSVQVSIGGTEFNIGINQLTPLAEGLLQVAKEIEVK